MTGVECFGLIWVRGVVGLNLGIRSNGLILVVGVVWKWDEVLHEVNFGVV